MAANRQSLSSGLARALLASLLPHSCCLVTAFHAGLMLQNLSICENPVTDSQPPREPLLKRRGPRTLLVRACLALPTGFVAIHTATEGDVFTQQRQTTQRTCFHSHSHPEIEEVPQQEAEPWSQPGKRPAADCRRQQTPSHGGILALFWFEPGPTPDFLPNEALKELHASCNSVRPCKLASQGSAGPFGRHQHVQQGHPGLCFKRR